MSETERQPSSQDLSVLIETAPVALAAAARVAETDVSRPRFHFRAPGQWMDDPNGIIYHGGTYHVMYSLNPHSSEHRAGMVYRTSERVWDPMSPDWTGGITVWGHAVSPDLVHWEHQPIALYPSVDKGEHFIWFGSTAINDEGLPIAIYTAIGPQLRPEDTAEQWAAIGSADLRSWSPLASNPVLVDTVHDPLVVREWRDPFIFRKDDRVFMILGARTGPDDGGDPVVLLYETSNSAFTEWEYRGVLYRHDDRETPSIECPNLVEVDGEWVMIFSPHGRVQYAVGDLDVDAPSFTVRSRGTVDHSDNFYATNVMHGPDATPILWAAVEGFANTRGWNGALSLPRSLSMNDGRLQQRPVRELEILRGRRTDTTTCLEAPTDLGEAPGGVAELIVDAKAGTAARWELRLDSGSGTLRVQLSPSTVTILTGDAIRLEFTLTEAITQRLQLHLDRSVLDLTVNDTDCATVVVPAVTGTVSASAVPLGTEAVEIAATLWELNAEGLFDGSVLP